MKNLRVLRPSFFLRTSVTVFLALALSLPILMFAQAAPPAPTSPLPASGPGLAPIEQYIAGAWDTLTRSMTECSSIVDPKLKAAPVLYLPADFPVPAAVEKLHRDCNVQVEHLPIVLHKLGEIDTSKFQPQGLLYLPNKYVVPGGRFNEMYGWDSYFIVRGLVRAGRLDLARGMIENFFFEIEHYGGFLNANRTYYLTRSQPPFLSSMVTAVYAADKEAGHADAAWLARAYAYIVRDHELWIHDPHLAGETGLSRYFDFGEGPPPEALQDESGLYRKVVTYFLMHSDENNHYLVPRKADLSDKGYGASYSISVCDVPMTMARPECEAKRIVSLSADYYKGDRAVRESGFDVSFRFGPFSAATHHFAPVCLNSLLFKTETDLAQIAKELGKAAEAEQWQQQAANRRKAMNQYFWSPERGLFMDYNFDTGSRSSYLYATAFYPLWAGVATDEQAQATLHNLGSFDQPGGIVMSMYDSGTQWDSPYGWAPLQLITVEGLRRYGLNEDADRVSREFLSNVLDNFRHDGTIREKYNVITRSSETNVQAGYSMNVVGFGWTNGVFLELLHQLPKTSVEWLEKHSETDKKALSPLAK
jgi:alpha,alpha-trehalase